MREQDTSQQQMMARAMKDDAFRQELLANPKAVLERELGMTLPRGVSIQVHEDTATILHFVLPMKPPAGEPLELSDAQLQQAIGNLALWFDLWHGKDMQEPEQAAVDEPAAGKDMHEAAVDEIPDEESESAGKDMHESGKDLAVDEPAAGKDMHEAAVDEVDASGKDMHESGKDL